MLGIIKGDIRYLYLKDLMECVISDKLEDFYDIDSLLLPFNGINSDYTIKLTNINILDILKNNSIKVIYTGNANNELISLCKNNNIKLFEFLKDDIFLNENGLLTAKGLIYFLNSSDYDISNKLILILGYGNISYHLCKLLRAYKCNFNIYTINPLERKYLLLEGYNFSNINDKYDLIINTIPYNLDIDYSLLGKAKIYDIASYPYGFDIERIINNNIDYEIISQIPSKYAPISASLLIKNFLENNN